MRQCTTQRIHVYTVSYFSSQKVASFIVPEPTKKNGSGVARKKKIHKERKLDDTDCSAGRTLLYAPQRGVPANVHPGLLALSDGILTIFGPLWPSTGPRYSIFVFVCFRSTFETGPITLLSTERHRHIDTLLSDDVDKVPPPGR